MKNTKIFFTFIFCSFIILFGGCSNQKERFEKFEHYDLKDKTTNIHTFHHNSGENTYAVADITKERKDEGGVNGIFYQINESEYILLDEIESCGYQESDGIHMSKNYTYFYQDEEKEIDKLYINRCQGRLLVEYTLNKENIKHNKLEFDFPKVSDNPMEYIEINTIEKVEKNNIYFKVRIANTGQSDIIMKCSLENKKCKNEN